MKRGTPIWGNAPTSHMQHEEPSQTPGAVARTRLAECRPRDSQPCSMANRGTQWYPLYIHIYIYIYIHTYIYIAKNLYVYVYIYMSPIRYDDPHCRNSHEGCSCGRNPPPTWQSTAQTPWNVHMSRPRDELGECHHDERKALRRACDLQSVHLYEDQANGKVP